MTGADKVAHKTTQSTLHGTSAAKASLHHSLESEYELVNEIICECS